MSQSQVHAIPATTVVSHSCILFLLISCSCGLLFSCSIVLLFASSPSQEATKRFEKASKHCDQVSGESTWDARLPFLSLVHSYTSCSTVRCTCLASEPTSPVCMRSVGSQRWIVTNFVSAQHHPSHQSFLSTVETPPRSAPALHSHLIAVHVHVCAWLSMSLLTPGSLHITPSSPVPLPALPSMVF